MKHHSMFRLKGVVQHYSWGGNVFLPRLLDMENSNRQPFAEYWLGAHDNAPALVVDGNKFVPLNDLIKKDPKALLGKNVVAAFSKLPYLLKILDVKDMLSIQVHPSKKNAEAGFKKEHEAGIPLSAPHRNYKDDNHKPELMVALSDFWLLHGFKSPELMQQTLSSVNELKPLLKIFTKHSYEGLYRHVMEMPQARVNEMLQPLLQRIIPAYHQQALEKDSPDFWAARAALTFNVTPDTDRGIFSVYFLNLVHLKKGEAIYQKDGILHAYLEGQNVEIMANSDNVLRGGLTPKHVDVDELVKQVKFKPVKPSVIRPKKGETETVFTTPAKDFELRLLQLSSKSRAKHKAHTAEILLLMEGGVVLGEKELEMHLKPGDAVMLFSGAQVSITAQESSALYIATVPL